jgi:hypothetical protein
MIHTKWRQVPGHLLNSLDCSNFSTLSLFFFFWWLYFWDRVNVAQAGLELSVYSWLAPYSWSSHFCLLSARITVMYHHVHFQSILIPMQCSSLPNSLQLIYCSGHPFQNSEKVQLEWHIFKLRSSKTSILEMFNRISSFQNYHPSLYYCQTGFLWF